MKIKHLGGLTAMSIFLTACQSNIFSIHGHVTGLTEGDTLLLTSADNSEGIWNSNLPHPGEKIAIDKNGNFNYEGIADSIEECFLYNPQSEYYFYVFFKEPGVNLQMNLHSGTLLSGFNYIQGSKLNNDLTSVTNTIDSLKIASARIINIRSKAELSSAEEEKVEEIERRIQTLIINSINNNISNELGYYMLTDYGRFWNIDDNVLYACIGKMPAKMRERHEIKKIVEKLEKKSNRAIGQNLKGLRMPTPNGKIVSVSQEIKKNKITIIDFWASWCVPCRKEMRNIIDLHDKYKNKGVGVIGISLDSNVDEWEKAIKKLNIQWLQLSDLKEWDNAGVKLFNIHNIPYTVIIDNQGNIIGRDLRGKQLSDFIEERSRLIN